MKIPTNRGSLPSCEIEELCWRSTSGNLWNGFTFNWVNYRFNLWNHLKKREEMPNWWNGFHHRVSSISFPFHLIPPISYHNWHLPSTLHSKRLLKLFFIFLIDKLGWRLLKLREFRLLSSISYETRQIIGVNSTFDRKKEILTEFVNLHMGYIYSAS